MATTLEHLTAKTSEITPLDVRALLSELGETCRTRARFYREALRAVAKHFGSPYAAIQITQSASALRESVTSADDDGVVWKSAAERVLLESQAENVPIARLYGVKGASLQVVALAVPVPKQSNRPIGAMSLIARCDDATCAKAYLGELAALVSLIAVHARRIESEGKLATEGDSALKRAVVKAADFESLDELAFAVTNTLKNKFACDQVTLGLVRGGSLRILSISGLDNVYPRSPGVKHVRQALEECLDIGEVLCSQEEDKWSEDSVATNHRVHKQWREEVGNGPVASVPLLIGDTCVAVLGLSRSKAAPFTAAELTRIRETVTPFGPAIVLVAKADRGLFKHATDTVKNGSRWLLAPGAYRRKAIAAAILASVAYFCLATIDYEITVPSRITPTTVHCLASPFQGTVKACYFKVGDEVVEGQVLYGMDTTDLQLQGDKLESDLVVLQLRVNQALAADEIRSAALAKAEMRVVNAQLAIVRHNLAGAQVRAPSNGTIASGDLSKRVGEVVPMGAPLLEFVPEGDWSIELLAPETRATELQVGFEGQFACNARPGSPLRCQIVRIQPSSEVVDGKNVFIAKATVKGNPAWMRAGMEGVAQINAGKRRLWWVASHRIIDNLRLNFWL